MLTPEFKEKLLEIIKNDSEELINEWIKYFDEDEKDDQYRYYDDFLGFFEECVENDLDLHSDEAKALQHFLLKIKDIMGEEKFFNFNDSVYTCFLKVPIFKLMDKHGLFSSQNVIPITSFFEAMTSHIILDFVSKAREIHESSTKELEAREAPMSEIWDRVLMVSIVGTLDSQRVIEILDKVLNYLENNRSEHVIIDIGSIFDVNTEVTNQLMKLYNAIHFMGAKVYFSGITANIAKSLTHLDISFGNIKTYSTTKQAVKEIIAKES